MPSSLGATLRISLRRSRADWPIVAAAALICLLAATVLAAGSIYGSAVAAAGLQRTLADASIADGAITVTTSTPASRIVALDRAVSAELERTFPPSGGAIARVATSDSFALPDQAADAVRSLAVLGYAEGLADHATLLDGRWPDAVPTAGDVTPVAVTADVADRLALQIGRQLTLESRLEPGSFVRVEVVGTFRIDDASARYWWGDVQAVDGVVTSDRFDIYGPLFTTLNALQTAPAVRSVGFAWHASPDSSAITLADAGPLGTRVAELPGRIDAVATSHISVRSGLPDLLARTERSLLVSRSGVLLLTIQLVVLAAYSALLSASLLVEHRRVGTAMLRSRGAGTSRIVALALAEGALLTIPAALVAPFLASVLLQAFNLTGPLADIGLAIAPGVTTDAFVAAAAGAGVCLAALTLPAFRTARSFASVDGDVARGQTSGIAQRLGIDIALLAVAAIGLWQLRLYGAPLTRSVQGALGLDPLLVATPAIGLLAGAIIALRLVPMLALLLEQATTRRRSLVPSLGARQLSRRPLRYTRAALLLVLATAMGVFAVSYTWTWLASQHDQATFQVGADVRVEPGTSVEAPPRWGLDRAYSAVPGVTEQMPVDRDNFPTSRTSRPGRLVALDATTAPAVVKLRSDLSDATVGQLMAPLVAGRPVVEAIRLPGEPRALRLEAAIEIRHLEQQVFDSEQGNVVNTPVEPAAVAGWRGFGVSVVVRDALGLLHRFSGGTATIDPGGHELVVPLGAAPAGGAPASFAYPLDLLAVELAASLPQGYETRDATLSVSRLAIAGPGGTWQPAALELAEGWRSTVAFFGSPHVPVEDLITGPTLTAAVGGPGLRVLGGVDQFGKGTILTFAAAALGHVADTPVSIIASDRFLEATAASVGDTVGLLIHGVRRQALVTAAVRAFPATDPADPSAVIDLPTLSLLRFEGSDAVEPPREWWLAAREGSSTSVEAALRTAPIRSRSVIGLEARTRALAGDAVALGIIGGLAIAFVAAVVFAVVGFVVSASVSARERVTEFALLRALGLSPGQLSVWLSLENAVLAAVSLVAGTVLGLVMAWLVLPFITVTQGATTPYPPVTLDVPWTLVGILVAISVLALAATVASLAWLLPRIGLAGVLRMSED